MSREISARIADVRGHMDARWSPERQRDVWQGILHAQQLQRRNRIAGVAGAAVATLACLVLIIRSWGAPDAGTNPIATHPVVEAASSPELLLRLDDGSTVTAVHDSARADGTARDKVAEVKPILVSPQEVELRLLGGAARFSVTPDKNRQFRVLAGDVMVTVLGTIFDVALGRDQVTVSVERGRVRVEGTATTKELVRGERAVFPLHRSAPQADNTIDLSLLETLEKAEDRSRARTQVSWRDLARKGDYESAFVALEKVKHSSVRNSPEDLLLSADVARLSGHPSSAVAPLTQLVSGHSGDPRAPLAAFTLGRVLLDQLGRPREAANAFARARQLAPSGSLAEDSLAREVESWSRAGDIEQARSGARRYLNSYPNSPRVRSVKRWAQLAD